MECIIMVGLPASGKSTYAKEHYSDTHIRLNLDMLNTRYREEVLFKACLEAKQSVIIDNTNITVEERSRYIQRAKKKKFSVRCIHITTNPETCLVRNTLRKRKVPAIAIYSRVAKLERPTKDEGFDSIEVITTDSVF